jgi:uncharacterized protein YqjF (DUF2071 family)
MAQGKRVFLSAEWRDLLILNYEVDGELLEGYVPPGTVLDSFEGKAYVSLVGFRFRHTKLLGVLPIPLHREFEEVNLRFYVRRREGNEDRRGVVFIAEIVPKRAVALVARLAYRENYLYFPMKHSVSTNGGIKKVEYAWQLSRDWCKLHAQSSTASVASREGSLEQFITEHYWGYSRQRSGNALEYHVSHRPWNVWATADAGFEGEASAVYGSALGRLLQRRPDSAFIADGSPVVVFAGRKIG